jgi:DNA-binding CsgD family transcriptional regulator
MRSTTAPCCEAYNRAVLLERSDAYERIDQALAEARAGGSAVLVVRGDPGLGKTALLREAVARADGFTVLSCRGYESESQLAFAGLGDLLRPAAAHLPALVDAQRQALEGALALAQAVSPDRLTVYVGVLSLLSATAEHGAVLAVVDDAQWLDPASAEALAFVGRRLGAEGVALLVAVRDVEDAVFDGREFPVVELEPLSPGAARSLAEPLARGEVDRVVELAAGNPLALLELAQAPAAEWAVSADAAGRDSPTIRGAFQRRIGALGDPTREAMLIAAAADRADAGLIARALAARGLAMSDLEPAERAGLVELTGGSVVFVHPLCRSTTYTGVDAAERRAAHASLAAVLVEPGEEEVRAWHLAAAAVAPDEEIAKALEAGGRRARSIGAYATAVAAFQRAADMSPDRRIAGQRLLLAAEAANMVGEGTRSLALLDTAGTLVVDDTDVASLEQLRARVEARSGSSAEAYRLLRSASVRLDPRDPPRAALALIEAVEAAIRCGLPADALDAANDARRLSGEPTNPVGVFATLATAASYVFLGDSVRALELVLTAADAAREVALDEQIRGYLAMVLAFNEEFDAARVVLDDLVAEARRRSAPGALGFPLISLGWVDRTTGRWLGASGNLYEAADLAAELRRRNDECWALSVLSWIEAAQGRDAECAAHVARQLELQTQLGLPFQLAAAHATLGLQALGAGRVDDAIAELSAALDVKQQHQYCDATTYPPVTPDLVEALVRAGRTAEATAVHERFREEAEASGRASAQALALRTAGLLADADQFDEPFQDALALQPDHHDLFAHARTQLCYGAALRRAGRRRDSRTHAAAAMEAFTALRAEPWAAQAAEGLERSAQTLKARDARDDLTPAEWQIATAIEHGLTNKEIGAQLFMSPKTVEAHLTHIYGKLGIRRRTELAHWYRSQDSAVVAS